jgi:hypothetical protein
VNLHRGEHAQRLALLAEDLVAPLRLVAQLDSARVDVSATLGGAPAVGLPLQCVFDANRLAVVTDENGRAVCEIELPSSGESARVTVRPDISGYLAAIPGEASGLANVLGRLLDRAVHLDALQPLEMRIALAGGASCGPATELLRRHLGEVGVQVIEVIDDGPSLRVACEIEDGERTGNLYTTTARGVLMLEVSDHRITDYLDPTHGLGATQNAAREDALQKLGRELIASALQLLRDYDV